MLLHFNVTQHTWHKFGYAVKEATSELQNAMENNLIQSIKFKDVRYICSWSRCAPGFYAAVEITVEPPITDPPRSGQPPYSGHYPCYGLKLP